MKKMEDIMKKTLKENKNKVVRIVQQNNFIYKGTITDFDDSCIKILDFRSSIEHVIRYDWIKHLEILE